MIPYKYVISFLGTQQQKNWAKPSSRIILFSPLDSFETLAKAYPEIWRYEFGDISRRDRSDFKWIRVYEDMISRQHNNQSLSKESDFVYDPATETIIFIKFEDTEKLKEMLPTIEQFIDSGDALLNL